VSVDVTFFEFVPYFSPQASITISGTAPPSLTVPLPTPASTVSSPVPPVETQDPPATKPVQNFRYVNSHRPKVPTSEPVPVIPSPVDGLPSPPSASFSDLDTPIVLRKGKQSCTDHPISNFISYDYLNPTFLQFVLSLSSEYIPHSYTEALLVPAWKQVMDEEMEALTSRETWELVSTPTNTVVGCRWVFTLKYRPDGSVDRYKVRLVLKGYT